MATDQTTLADPECPMFPFERDLPFDPPPVLKQLRDECPVSRVRLFDDRLAWIVTRYDDVRQVCSDARFSANTSAEGYPEVFAGRREAANKERTFIGMDPPEHDLHRRMLTSAFIVKRAEAMRPEIQAFVDNLVDGLVAGPRPADLVANFALPLPTWVICKLLGVPEHDHLFFQERAGARLNFSNPPEAVAKATTELMEYLADLVERKRTEPGDDILSRLLVERVDRGELTNAELVDMSRMLLIAGHETTASMIALGVLVLLDHPDQLAELRADSSLMPGAVEELLRILTIPQLLVGRVATEPVEVGGQMIAAGEGVRALINSANRDERVFADANRFDIHRNPRNHVAFGFGIHQCLGQAYARVEMQVALQTLITRLPGLHLVVPLREVPFKYESAVHGVHEVLVDWDRP